MTTDKLSFTPIDVKSKLSVNLKINIMILQNIDILQVLFNI